MSLLEDGQVLTADRLTNEIDRQVTAAVATITPPTPATGASLVKRVSMATVRPTARFGYAAGDVVDTQTWHHTRTTETPPSFVRLVWPYDQLTTCTITGAIIAPSASVVDPINPVDTLGAPVSWIPVTFNNAGLPLTLKQQLDAEDDQVGADDTIQVLTQPPVNGSVWPNGTRLKSQRYTYSDWIPIKSLARTDVPGGFPVIMDRVKFTGAISVQTELSDADHANLGGRQLRAYANTGDCVTTPASFVSTTKTLAATPMMEYITAHPTVTIAVAGDSTQTPPANHVSLAVYELSSTSFPIEFLAGGTGGFDAEAYCGNMRRQAQYQQPSIVFIQMRSANGIASVADTESDWAISMALVQTVKEYGGIPVLMTPLPCPARITTEAVELSRLDIVARCLAAETAGAYVLDLDDYYSDDATPIAGFASGLSDDGIHPTAAAQALCATELTIPFLRNLLGL